MSTVFDYANPIMETMDKEVLFALVKREGVGSLLDSDKRALYKNMTLKAINGVTVEQIDRNIKDIRGMDACTYGFYVIAIELYVEALISKERFVSIMQVIPKQNLDTSRIEDFRRKAIGEIPRKFEEDGLAVMRIVLEELMPDNKKSLIMHICKEPLHESYRDLLSQYYPSVVEECMKDSKKRNDSITRFFGADFDE